MKAALQKLLLQESSTTEVTNTKPDEQTMTEKSVTTAVQTSTVEKNTEISATAQSQLPHRIENLGGSQKEV